MGPTRRGPIMLRASVIEEIRAAIRRGSESKAPSDYEAAADLCDDALSLGEAAAHERAELAHWARLCREDAREATERAQREATDLAPLLPDEGPRGLICRAEDGAILLADDWASVRLDVAQAAALRFELQCNRLEDSLAVWEWTQHRGIA